MGRKGKGKSVKRNRQLKDVEPEELKHAPHSFVITRGNVGGCVDDLTRDFRKVMEPFTASMIKASKKNALKDFVAVSGLLHVSHMNIFSQTDIGVYFKLCRLPRGPTLSFRVHNYCLSRDILSSIRKPVATDKLHAHPPLVVLNNFSGEGMHLKLMASTFQNMFPTINLTRVNLSNIRRCVMLSYDPETKLIDFRHYAIKVVPVGLSRGVKKIVQSKVPNLSRFNNIADFITKAGEMSESEAEDDPNSHVVLPQELSSRGNMAANKSAVRLCELGPRMTLQLMKVEEGLLNGEVLFHEYISKTKEEKEVIRKTRQQKMKLKESRRREQEDKVRHKEKLRHDNKKRSLAGMPEKEVLEPDDDLEWYRKEVGQEPEEDLFDTAHGGKRRFNDREEGEDRPYKKLRFSNDVQTEKGGFKTDDKPGLRGEGRGRSPFRDRRRDDTSLRGRGRDRRRDDTSFRGRGRDRDDSDFRGGGRGRGMSDSGFRGRDRSESKFGRGGSGFRNDRNDSFKSNRGGFRGGSRGGSRGSRSGSRGSRGKSSGRRGRR